MKRKGIIPPSNSWDDVEFHVYMLLQPSKHSKMF